MKFWKKKHRSASFGERRLDQRKSSIIHAAMCWEDYTRKCRITSISLTGMFLELSAVNLEIGAQLELFFYCSIDNSKKLCSEWVRVVGPRKNGVAVSYVRFDNQHQSNMQLILNAISEMQSLPPVKYNDQGLAA